MLVPRSGAYPAITSFMRPAGIDADTVPSGRPASEGAVPAPGAGMAVARGEHPWNRLRAAASRAGAKKAFSGANAANLGVFTARGG